MSEDSDAKIDAANAMLDELENKKREGQESDDEDMEKSKLEKFGQREINNKEKINTRLHEVK